MSHTPAIPPAPPRAPPSRLPLVLSGVVFPGTGQLAQRRWFAAAVFGLGSVVAVGFFAVSSAVVLVAFYRLGLDPAAYRDTPLPWRSVVASLLVTIVLYVAGIVDTFLAYRRAAARATHTRFLNALPRADRGQDHRT